MERGRNFGHPSSPALLPPTWLFATWTFLLKKETNADLAIFGLELKEYKLLSILTLFSFFSYSAGVGRTGCFIAASVGIEQVKVCSGAVYVFTHWLVFY